MARTKVPLRVHCYRVTGHDLGCHRLKVCCLLLPPRHIVQHTMAQPTTAAAPFDKPSASIILRTSDNVDFHAHKEVLSLASSVFEDMFAVPQPSVVAPEDVHAETGLPVISVTETSQTLDTLLRLCYPMDDPVLDNVDDAWEVLEAARKYQMDDAIGTKLKTALVVFVSKSPIRVYAIACIFHLESEARAAAHASLNMRTFDYDPALDKISAGAFHRLLEYRRISTKQKIISFTFCQPERPTLETRSPSVSSSLSSWRGRTPFQVEPLRPVSGVRLVREQMQKHAVNSQLTAGDNFPAPLPEQFTHDYSTTANTILQSSDGREFYVHDYILTLASPTFRCMLSQNEDVKPSEEGRACRRLVLPETSVTLLQLLHSCYQTGFVSRINNFMTVRDLLIAARKYEVNDAVRYATQKWTQLTVAAPLRAYFIAIEHGWKVEGRQAALHLVFQRRDYFIPEMETATAGVYHRVLCFRQRALESLRAGYYYHWSDAQYDTSTGLDDNAYEDYMLALDNQKTPLLVSFCGSEHLGESSPCRAAVRRGRQIITALEKVNF